MQDGYNRVFYLILTNLKESFKDAFILFHPRDIVSGDFYWFDKLDDDKFILVCADSTGHGVPGAFMSMIGSTLFRILLPGREYQNHQRF